MKPETAPRPRGKKEPQDALFPPPPKRVLVTGATGFVGRAVVAELVRRGWQVAALARRHPTGEAEPGLVRIAADVTSPRWERWAQGCQAAVHLVGIIRERPKEGVTFQKIHLEGTARVLAVCQSLGIRRLIHMSAAGADPQGMTPYHRTKGEAEELVMASGLAWTIFRPSVIFGPGDGFTTTLKKVVGRWPLVPVFGDGSFPVQPVAVEEVAEAFAESLTNPATEGKVIELGGPEVISYLEVLQRLAAAMGNKRLFVKVPLGLARMMVRLTARVLSNPPITPDELSMLIAGSQADNTLATQFFHLPRRRLLAPVTELAE